MIKSLNRLTQDTRGAVAIEFGMVAIVLVLFTAGIVDYGRFIHSRMQLENTARTAAQYVLQGGNPADLQSNVVQKSNMGLANASLVATEICQCADGNEVVCSGGSCGANDYVRHLIDVTVTRPFTPIMPYPGLPKPAVARGSARLQVE